VSLFFLIFIFAFHSNRSWGWRNERRRQVSIDRPLTCLVVTYLYVQFLRVHSFEFLWEWRRRRRRCEVRTDSCTERVCTCFSYLFLEEKTRIERRCRAKEESTTRLHFWEYSFFSSTEPYLELKSCFSCHVIVNLYSTLVTREETFRDEMPNKPKEVKLFYMFARRVKCYGRDLKRLWVHLLPLS
jgi:hypothetical protein